MDNWQLLIISYWLIPRASPNHFGGASRLPVGRLGAGDLTSAAYNLGTPDLELATHSLAKEALMLEPARHLLGNPKNRVWGLGLGLQFYLQLIVFRAYVHIDDTCGWRLPFPKRRKTVIFTSSRLSAIFNTHFWTQETSGLSRRPQQRFVIFLCYFRPTKNVLESKWPMKSCQRLRIKYQLRFPKLPYIYIYIYI